MHDALGGVQQIVDAIYKENEPHLFFFRECVDAYEKSQGDIQGFPSMYSCFVALEAIQARSTHLMEVLIASVEKEIDITIEIAVTVKKHSRFDKNPSSRSNDTVRKVTEEAKSAEASTVESIRSKLESQIERVAGMLLRVQQLMDARKQQVKQPRDTKEQRA